eukprot:CAMPEP_0180146608 /NCGR_PEP_ID=MMETSP0986-20121125/18634_1 /TAXON_ID=697907 /ORGANISM="non described non described, Strain CCMP2293" /LENGTH=115 /DNA_ID=CAMNT_0022091743 /DNA_START=342 /DNA_END=688 /DNA_ORIENTATION=+
MSSLASQNSKCLHSDRALPIGHAGNDGAKRGYCPLGHETSYGCAVQVGSEQSTFSSTVPVPSPACDGHSEAAAVGLGARVARASTLVLEFQAAALECELLLVRRALAPLVALEEP